MKYPIELKIKVINSKKPVKEIAKEFGVSTRSVRRWKKKEKEIRKKEIKVTKKGLSKEEVEEIEKLFKNATQSQIYPEKKSKKKLKGKSKKKSKKKSKEKSKEKSKDKSKNPELEKINNSTTPQLLKAILLELKKVNAFINLRFGLKDKSKEYKKIIFKVLYKDHDFDQLSDKELDILEIENPELYDKILLD